MKPFATCRARARLGLLMLLPVLLAACAAPKYTVDDGRKLDEQLLGQIRAYGEGERSLRPAIVRSAGLQDKQCDKQWELPFAVATSAGWTEDERVAWVRALGVDERLTVVATAPGSPLQLGDRIVQVAGVQTEDRERMLATLAERRDAGRPFELQLASGKRHSIKPFEVCRGYVRLAPPNTPKAQDYHWMMSLHPLEITRAAPSEDEALWAVLWSQGLSEEAGGAMKTYHYGSKIAGTVYNLFTLATGLKGAALAADAAIKAAKSAAANVASDLLKQQLLEQGRQLATQKIREGLADAAQQLSRQQVMDAMQAAAANRGSLSGVAYVAARYFDDADRWAFERMARLGGRPLAGLSLHQKLIERGLTSNAFALDVERLVALSKLAELQGLEPEVLAILRGLRPEDLELALASMPLASSPGSFSFESSDDPAARLAARGLIDTMLELPAESAGAAGKK